MKSGRALNVKVRKCKFILCVTKRRVKKYVSLPHHVLALNKYKGQRGL